MFEYKDIAIKAAKKAGRIILDYYNKELKEHTKQRGDVVTVADKESEKVIFNLISKSFPKHSIFSEESLMDDKDSDYLWVVDPLDGTSNFVVGIPYFSVSIALLYKGKTILGVVYYPSEDRLYTAELNKGAFVSGKKIESKKCEKKIIALIAGYPCADRIPKNFPKIVDNCYRVLLNWSPALDLCLIAEGKIQGMIAFENEMEDTLAALLIIKEAGCLVRDFSNKDYEIEKFDILNKDFLVGADEQVVEWLIKLAAD